MPTIKGPIHFKSGFNFVEFMKKQGIKIKLPFSATGWKSSKTPEGVDMSNIKLAKDNKVKTAPVKNVTAKKIVVKKAAVKKSK